MNLYCACRQIIKLNHIPYRIKAIRSFSTKLNMASKLSVGADRIQGLDHSVWVEFTGLARECNAVNVGQGFPDFPPPDYIMKALNEAASGSNFMLYQYTRSFGHIRLVNALAKFYGLLLKQNIDPMKEVLVTVGAYNALFYAAFGLLNPGDEAIIIEPFYDCYEPQVRMAGGIPVFVPMRFKPRSTGSVLSSADFSIDFGELESKFSSKTKLLFLNNPVNPSGKVFNRDELMQIARLAKKYDVIVIADEVYEWLVYPGVEMIRFATLPDMWERTITIGSAGKTFSVTGWKLGWAIAPFHIMKSLQAVHQNCVYTCPTQTQEAAAIGLEFEMTRLNTPECYFNQLPRILLPKREKMAAFLTEVGMKPIVPEGGYFMLADYSSLHGNFDAPGDDPKDYRFVRWMCREKKLAAIPPTAFYSADHKHMAENFVRFCFFKEDSTLLAAEKIIKNWKASTTTQAG